MNHQDEIEYKRICELTEKAKTLFTDKDQQLEWVGHEMQRIAEAELKAADFQTQQAVMQAFNDSAAELDRAFIKTQNLIKSLNGANSKELQQKLEAIKRERTK